MRAALTLLLPLAVAACAQPAPPPAAAPRLPPALDADADGWVSEAELARAAADAFAGLDLDRDGLLDPGEAAGLPPERRAGLDVNGDGRLSFAEIMAQRLEAHAAADRDRDGRLSPSELAAAAPGPLPARAATAPDPSPAAAGPEERRRLDYARLSAIDQAELQRRIHAQQLFEQWRRQAGSPVQTLPAGDPGDAETRVASAQRMLKGLGYYAGPADGLLGPATRAAVARFQAEHGLPPTGDVSPVLLERLRQAL